jgi:hypothetical protein
VTLLRHTGIFILASQHLSGDTEENHKLDQKTDIRAGISAQGLPNKKQDCWPMQSDAGCKTVLKLKVFKDVKVYILVFRAMPPCTVIGYY